MYAWKLWYILSPSWVWIANYAMQSALSTGKMRKWWKTQWALHCELKLNYHQTDCSTDVDLQLEAHTKCSLKGYSWRKALCKHKTHIPTIEMPMPEVSSVTLCSSANTVTHYTWYRVQVWNGFIDQLQQKCKCLQCTVCFRSPILFQWIGRDGLVKYVKAEPVTVLMYIRTRMNITPTVPHYHVLTTFTDLQCDAAQKQCLRKCHCCTQQHTCTCRRRLLTLQCHYWWSAGWHCWQ